jgi:hypothetical protein
VSFFIYPEENGERREFCSEGLIRGSKWVPISVGITVPISAQRARFFQNSESIVTRDFRISRQFQRGATKRWSQKDEF